jgi:hypothetical protein
MNDIFYMTAILQVCSPVCPSTMRIAYEEISVSSATERDTVAKIRASRLETK